MVNNSVLVIYSKVSFPVYTSFLKESNNEYKIPQASYQMKSAPSADIPAKNTERNVLVHMLEVCIISIVLQRTHGGTGYTDEHQEQ